MKIIVLGNAHREGVKEEADKLLPRLRGFCDVLLVDLVQKADLTQIEKADLALVLGGDGAILRAARQMGYQQIPVLGVNLGHLGFLADLDTEQLVKCFPDVVCGRYHVTRHLMFECVVEKKGGAGLNKEERTFLGLNEAAFHTLPPFPILDLALSMDGDLIAHFRGDGLIVSTPIGATAHSLSAGGPILGQELSAFVITPICPHTLTHRPVVESSEKTYIIGIGGQTGRAAVVIDGQDMVELSLEDRVIIRKAPVTFGLVKVPGKTFYGTLRDKLHWGKLPRYRLEP